MISTFTLKSMTPLILFILACLFNVTKTKQLQLENYMQMIYNQPPLYQPYTQMHPHHPHQPHHPHAHHLRRQQQQQQQLGNRYSAAVLPTSLTLANAALIGEDPASMLAGNLIDSLDVDDHGNQIEYPPSTNYQAKDHSGSSQFTMSTLNNNSLALYRLLNFIDQSVPTSPMSMPFQNSKTSQPTSAAAALGPITSGRSQRSNGNKSNNNININSNQNSNQRHQSLASQTTATSIPNYLNNWSRKQNQMYWQQQHQPQQNHLPNHQHHHHHHPQQQHQQQQQQQPKTISNNEKLKGALTSSTLSNSKVPHDADSEIIAANNAPRCDKFTPDICVDDFEYPEQAIIDEIQKKRDVFELMYSEVKDNEPLVDGIPRDVEESYNYDYYYYNRSNLYRAASHMSPIQLAEASSSSSSSSPLGSNVDGMDALIGAITPQASPSSTSLSAQSPPTTGFICPSEVMYGKPKLAKNKKGLWKVIVNAGEFTQTVRLEKCLLPNKKCNFVEATSYESRCAQIHSYHRLLVFEKGRGFYIDTFRLPTGCNCHVTRRNRAEPQAEPTTNRLSSESMLSQTLWSILSGGGVGASASANQLTQQQQQQQQQEDVSPAQREAYRSQSAILEHLSQNPRLAENISDSVLKQLIAL